MDEHLSLGQSGGREAPLPALAAFEKAHERELKAITQTLAEITQRSVGEIEPYLETLLEQLVGSEEQRFDVQQWEADLNALAQGAENIPVLPPEAFSRESIYGNHD